MTAIPEHGTVSRYKSTQSWDGCRCRPCTDAAVRDDAQRVLDRLAGRPRSIPAAPVWEHILQLRAKGLSDAQISRAAGMSSQSSITRIGTQPTIHRSTAEKILGVPLDYQPPVLRVPAVGATRRLQALYALGHSSPRMSRFLGCAPQIVVFIAHGRYTSMTPERDLKIRRMYALLATQPGTSRKARALAAQNSWHGPLAWNDIDDPDEKPETGEEVDTRRTFEIARERRDEVLHLARYGTDPAEIAARVGLSPTTVREQIRSANPALLIALTA